MVSMSRNKLILLTLIVWLVGTGVYAYCWVASLLAEPTTVGYERDALFLLFGFIVSRGIYLFFGIIVIVWAEVMLFETLFRKEREEF